MTDSAQASRARPVSQAERIGSIDVLRGFALLGILVMNIQSFAMPDAAYFNPTAYGDLEGANGQVWLWSRLLADQKFMTIFSMLFGAGIVLMTGRAEARGQGRRVHYRRMRWLMIFGLLHAHLLWSGDILFYYGLCGMLVYPLRERSPTTLLVLGALTLSVSSAIYIASGLSMQTWPPEALAEFTENFWKPSPEMIAVDLAAYRGTWIEQMASRTPAALFFETAVLLIWAGWRAGGLMLVGMALFKLGVFHASRSSRFYAGLIAAALLIGMPIEYYGVTLDFESGWAATWSFFQGRQYNYWPSIVVSLGWVGLVMLACKAGAFGVLLRPFAAVGQTALTNYLLQTIICTAIFYGHGLGYYGSVDRLGQFGVVLAVWAFQLIVSPLWLRSFYFGPFEWIWRALTYRSLPPLRRRSA